MTKRHRPSVEPPLIESAWELLGGIEDLERLASRVSEQNLPTWKAIARSGEMLTDAVAAHQRFVTALGALSERVGALRDRHNRAADVLAEQASRVDARRVSHQAFEERFAALAADARTTDELLHALPKPSEDLDPAAHVAAVASALASVRTHLSRAAADAGTLATDAAAAGFVELRQQAEQVRSQLESMLRRVESAAPDA